MPQTFQTTDWPLEAERVSWAFEVEEGCQFVPTNYAHEMQLQNGESGHLVQINGNLYVGATYSLCARIFTLTEKSQKWDAGRSTRTEIVIKWSNLALIHSNAPQNRFHLARALVRLGLMTPEIESELGATISAHVRLEWELEAEEWMK